MTLWACSSVAGRLPLTSLMTPRADFYLLRSGFYVSGTTEHSVHSGSYLSHPFHLWAEMTHHGVGGSSFSRCSNSAPRRLARGKVD